MSDSDDELVNFHRHDPFTNWPVYIPTMSIGCITMHNGTRCMYNVLTIPDEWAHRLLIDKNTIDAQDTYGWTALIYAIQRGKTNICKLLINNGANVNLVDANQTSPLIHAINRRKDCSPEIIQLLIDAGADINYCPMWGCQPPILSAAILNMKHVARLLLNAGTHVNTQIAITYINSLLDTERHYDYDKLTTACFFLRLFVKDSFVSQTISMTPFTLLLANNLESFGIFVLFCKYNYPIHKLLRGCIKNGNFVHALLIINCYTLGRSTRGTIRNNLHLYHLLI